MNLGSRRVCLFSVLAAAMLGMPTPAQVNGVDDISSLRIGEPTTADLLEDFIHYVMIAKPDLADGSARALLESGITDAELYKLVEDEIDKDRFEYALVRAMKMDALADIAGQLEMHIRHGRQDVARDPDEIARNIQLLVGNARAQQMAREALNAAGEFAVPQLLNVLRSPARQALKTECQLMLVRIGRQAVTPLCTALPHLDSVTQERICQVLAEINYKHALPTLFDLMNNADAQDSVRSAARQAYSRIGGILDADSEDLWLGLAEQYWSEAKSLVAWPGEETANVWNYDAQIGLNAVRVPSSIFAEIMTMRSTAKALEADRDSLDALSLWIAANFRRSDQLGNDVDPTYGPDMRPPMFYAVLAGPDAGQRVLARAISDLNTQLARHAIEALNSTAGGSSLWATEGRPTPLIGALIYPERRVRYDAALALGHALPTEGFEGSERVVPILAGAISTGGERFAAVIADKKEDQRTIAANLRNMGFTVLPAQSNYDDLQPDLLGTVGVDLFVINLPISQVGQTVDDIQADPRVAASPIMIMAPVDQLDELKPLTEDNRLVSAMRLGLDETQRTNAIMSHVEENLGKLMTSEEADDYAVDALETLRQIAVSNTDAFNVDQAAGALIQALGKFSGDLRLTAAETLSWVNTDKAQQALMRDALDESDTMTQIAFLLYVSDSARRFGSMVTTSQVSRLAQLIRTATGPVATSAATVHGALNLPASNAVDFITK